MREPRQDIHLGLWRACMLHEVAIRPIYPGLLIRRIADRGHKVSSSVAYDEIEFMKNKGWFALTGRIHSRGGEYLEITPAGRQRLADLRDELARMVHEINGSPAPAKGSKRAAVEALTEVLRRNEYECAKAKNALLQVAAVIEESLAQHK